ncbi:16S rRNA (guanine(966)-N(2))-methyltransferase RsmD [Mycolicibacillus koreensis]|nr:16S rRNA (guanine(966)-N(2))-methyltransferase RsmD [Mycolicibacillus koreensis]
MTRIIAGAARGRRLAVPPRGTRPTSDRVREALFNVLGARRDFAGLTVLDLYAGSGALGLEALSRGAAAVRLVESDARAAATITANIAAVDLPGAVLHRAPVAAVLAAGTDAAVDLVFADPPYHVDGDELVRMLGLLVDGGWVGPGALVVCERPAGGAALAWPDGWEPWEPRRYGDTRLELAERLVGADDRP